VQVPFSLQQAPQTWRPASGDPAVFHVFGPAAGYEIADGRRDTQRPAAFRVGPVASRIHGRIPVGGPASFEHGSPSHRKPHVQGVYHGQADDAFASGAERSSAACHEYRSRLRGRFAVYVSDGGFPLNGA